MARLLAGQTAIVTGASKGIGRAIVRHLLEHGVNVVAVARNEYGLERLQEEMRVGKRLLAVACDIRDQLEVERLFEVATDRFGRLEIVVNNAGVGAFAPIEEIDAVMLDEILDTNLKAVFYMCRAAFGHMKRHGGGQIVNIAALLGLESEAHASAYCASKWGVMGLSEALHLEGRPFGIRVATVAPGPTQTEFAGSSSSTRHPALRPETVAEGVAYLLTQGDDIRMSQLVLR
ncbi:SDR family oxidoreductase [Tumebacillus permanentifrigoris]|uniref:3-oxoacyl-[acyl-carrier protein] reductase n=1 Tax=Tumebacillus permanentifrigoris TaxID=378543 RepID=A0A316D3W8_9BACL|nr:SDR family NAD(P)-dependent oxidoreductase [Tumebacillus permanentifrigoris]PWK06646.1 3-oxoacyl-[acyl-carrier protein] reductase [Tumebacillus permanentifrigoris]